MSTTLGSRAAGRDAGNRASSPPAVRPVRAATGQVEHALDDTTPAIFSRIGARVSDADCLFTRHTEVHFSPPMQEMLRTKCPTEALSAAVEPCSAAVGESHHVNESPSKKALYNACLFDYCFGQVEHALQVAKEFATTQELKDGGLIK